MHVVDMEASNADKHISNANKRFAAMVQRTPIHTFLFNKRGELLVANDAAMEACLHSTAGLKLSQGQDVTLKSLFDLGSYPGQSRMPSCSAVCGPALFCFVPLVLFYSDPFCVFEILRCPHCWHRTIIVSSTATVMLCYALCAFKLFVH